MCPAAPSLMIAAVDVRDVARAHVAAMTNPKAKVGRPVWYYLISTLLVDIGC